MTEHKAADFLIVGAGSAGCVLANRLSAAGASVLILEAGRDMAPGAVPEDVADIFPRSYFNASYMWPDLHADLGVLEGRASEPFVQAKVTGGGSSVMGMIAMRGLPDDYERWKDAGAAGWGWDDVLPAFRKLETDWDFGGTLHGDSGPIPIRRYRREDWPPFPSAIARAAAARGFPMIDDMNSDFRDGFCRLPLSMTETHRVSAADAYLGEAIRARANLSLKCGITVDRLIFERGRCVGVSIVTGSRCEVLKAGHVILSAGAIQSPTLLLRSGVGPSVDLERLRIPVVAALGGVGANLQNHPVVYLATHLTPEARQSSRLRPPLITSMRVSTGDAPELRSDLSVMVMGKSSWRGLGQAIGGLGVALFCPFSRGTVRLSASDPAKSPEVRLNMLADGRDVARMVHGLRLALDLMRDDAVCSLRHELFVAGYSTTVRRLNRPGWRSVVAAEALGRVLDGPNALRRIVIRRGISRDEPAIQEIGEEAWVEGTVRRRAFAMYHPAGTCRIGAETDSAAVVDSHCRVHQVRCLSVVDASVMPTLVRGTTNIPVVMIAERAANLILNGRSGAD